MPLDLVALRQTPLDATLTKGLPVTAGTLTLEAIGQQGWNLLRQDLPFPLMILRQSALQHNAAAMGSYAAAAGVSLAPHGKTTMAPQLFDLQLANGAWGITAATMDQVWVMYRHGIRRIILANQLCGRANVQAAVTLLNRDPAFDFYCLVDSPRGVQQLAATCRELGLTRPLQVLLEAGIAGKRTGCRHREEAAATLAALRGAGGTLALAGLEGFEGVLPDAHAVDHFLHFALGLLDLMTPADFAGRNEMLLTAGGSAFFDRVVAQFGGAWTPVPARIVLRSGCYLTHDSGVYNHFLRLAQERGWQHGLQPALEAWSMVQSHPEPELAVLTMGKRDVPYDAGLPTPQRLFRPGLGWLPAPRGELTGTNDQHAIWKVEPEADLQVGDLVCCGISHPCTAFDKWRVLPVVDDAYDVVDAVLTFF